MDELPEITLGEYEHYKGNRYRVLSVARHSETLEPLAHGEPNAVTTDGLSGEVACFDKCLTDFVELLAVRAGEIVRVGR